MTERWIATVSMNYPATNFDQSLTNFIGFMNSGSSANRKYIPCKKSVQLTSITVSFLFF